MILTFSLALASISLLFVANVAKHFGLKEVLRFLNNNLVEPVGLFL